MSSVRDFYDATARLTADEWYGNTVLLPTLRQFMSLLPHRPRVLDLGCGPGYESGRLASLGAEILGIDISPECIKIARERNPGCEFSVRDFFDVDDTIGTFHGILASGSLIHVPPERMDELMTHIVPRLLDGGILSMILRDGRGSRVFTQVVNGSSFRKEIFLHSTEDLTAALSAHGLHYLTEGTLDGELQASGWKCHIFRKGAAAPV